MCSEFANTHVAAMQTEKAFQRQVGISRGYVDLFL